MYDNNFGGRLLAKLQEKGFTRKKLAESLQVTDVTVTNYINNKRQPSFEKLVLIGEILSVSIDELLGRASTGEMFPSELTERNRLILSYLGCRNFFEPDKNVFAVELPPHFVARDSSGKIFRAKRPLITFANLSDFNEFVNLIIDNSLKRNVSISENFSYEINQLDLADGDLTLYDERNTDSEQ